MKLKGLVKDFLQKKYPKVGFKESICSLVGKMKEGFLIVVKGREIVGIVTEMDVLRAVWKSSDPGKLRVQDCMTPCQATGYKTCFQIADNRPADEALEVMTLGDIGQLLVFDKKKKIIGMVSVNSLLKSIKSCKLI